ncbi:hypothetical protein HZC20_00550, partial [Candidatus Peregrinibacteria bacterium]|nr:hypothetical protein [Candidatus Peregrinibacteria bacterium]
MGKRYKMFVEILRKVFHLSGLVVLVGYTFLLNYFGARVAILVLTGLLLLLLEIERIRLDHKPRIA